MYFRVLWDSEGARVYETEKQRENSHAIVYK